MDPQNCWYNRELGVSYLERGYTKKAFPALTRAYDLGCRDLDFVLLYAQQCFENEKVKRAEQLILDLIPEGKKWKKDEMPYALEAYTAYFLITRTSGKNIEDFISRYCEFLRGHRTEVMAHADEYLYIMRMIFIDHQQWTGESLENVNKTLLILKAAAKKDEDKELLDNMFRKLAYSQLYKDSRICRSLHYFFEAQENSEDDEEALRKFLALDAFLCMIEERELILADEDYFRKTYPYFYDEGKVIFDQLRDARTAHVLKERLQKRFRQMEPSFGGSNYYEWYPEEKVKAYGRQKTTGEEPYIRAHKKTGRNDPCPCGSGKKFKQCCLGKGIYD